ncbi:MAG: 2-octaprenyl-6-methoxyphenyl hydroxylase [Pseudomonadales bacterium]|nr:2-octaprenyl-6-methoxyphenyl hydroxylase [Pseudomonadales bacterium]
MKKYDVLIVGGGMVGASLACALAAKTSLSIGVIEAKKLPQKTKAGDLSQHFNPSYDERSTALSLGSCRYLDTIGLWQSLQQHVEKIHHIHVSEQGKFGVTRLEKEEEGVEFLGAVVENAWLGVVLGAAMAAHSSISLHSPALLESLHPGDEGYHVCIEENGQSEKIQCGLLVVADGANSTCCKMLSIAQTQEDYDQTALVTNLTPKNPHQNIAYERFTRTGPMALLPLRDERLALVLTLPTEELEHYQAMSDSEFMHAVDQAIGGRCGGFSKVGKRVSYPLRLIRAEQQIIPGCVVIGNAAHSLHPIAGQGFNLSLRDVAILTEEIMDATDKKTALGNFSVLQRYIERRDLDQRATIQFSDKLQKLFTANVPGLGIARSAGLTVFDSWPTGKRALARQAMGLMAGVSTF